MVSRILTLPLTIAFALALLPAASLAAQELPPGPTFPVQSKFEAAAPQGAYELVQLVLDFPPGNWTPRHQHGGQVFVTVLGGEVVLRDDVGERTVHAGETWIERLGDHHVAGNASGENARVLVTFLLPKGADLTTVDQAPGSAELPPGPTLVYQTRTPGTAASGELEVVQLVGDFAPGAWTPKHEHGGRGVVTVLEGTLAVRDQAGERTFGPGESWIEGSGEVAAVGNPGPSTGRIAATFVLAKGAALTTVREPGAAAQLPAALPRTGQGGGSGGDPWGQTKALLALTAAGMLLLGLRRPRRGALER